MGRPSKRWIDKDKFESIKHGDMLKVRYMSGTAIVQQNPDVDKNEVSVKFEGSPWNDRTLNLIRQQISKVL